MNAKRFIVSIVATMAILVAPVATMAGFFPADRQTYTCNGIVCPGADKVVFNSFTNNPVAGDERPFFAGSKNGANVEDRLKVSDGDNIVLRAYVHNNADPNKMGAAAAIAKNTKIKVLVPTVKQNDHNLVAFISADNASPKMINDTMSLYGDRDFTLEYVAGSAKFDQKPDGVNLQTFNLSDNIVAAGASLGDIKGCFQYSGWVTLRVKVHMDKAPVQPSYSCDLLKVVALGENKYNFTANATAKDGATISKYVFDFGDGVKVESTNPTVSHQYAKAGTYNTTVKVMVKVNGVDKEATSQSCAAQVKVPETPTPPVTPPTTPTPPANPPTPTTPTSLPNTGAGSVIGLFAGSSLLAAGVHYFVRVRRGLVG